LNNAVTLSWPTTDAHLPIAASKYTCTRVCAIPVYSLRTAVHASPHGVHCSPTALSRTSLQQAAHGVTLQWVWSGWHAQQYSSPHSHTLMWALLMASHQRALPESRPDAIDRLATICPSAVAHTKPMHPHPPASICSSLSSTHTLCNYRCLSTLYRQGSLQRSVLPWST